MASRLRQSMLRYYDERASQYEEAYVLGTRTASIPDPAVFQAENKYSLTASIEHFGTAFSAVSGGFTRGISTRNS